MILPRRRKPARELNTDDQKIGIAIHRHSFAVRVK
jgi:hypothetical protein